MITSSIGERLQATKGYAQPKSLKPLASAGPRLAFSVFAQGTLYATRVKQPKSGFQAEWTGFRDFDTSCPIRCYRSCGQIRRRIPVTSVLSSWRCRFLSGRAVRTQPRVYDQGEQAVPVAYPVLAGNARANSGRASGIKPKRGGQFTVAGSSRYHHQMPLCARSFRFHPNRRAHDYPGLREVRRGGPETHGHGGGQ